MNELEIIAGKIYDENDRIVNTHSWNNGIYFLHLTGNIRQTFRLIKIN